MKKRGVNVKLLFIALCDYSDMSNGVTIKVISQYNAFLENGHDVTLISFSKNCVYRLHCKNESLIKVKTKRSGIFNTVCNEIKNKDYDACYFRFCHFDFFSMRSLRKMHKRGIRVYLEMPSYPIKYTPGKIGMYYKFFDYLNQKIVKRYIYKILSVGHETNYIYGIENVSIPNGLPKLANIKINLNYDEINMISVSNMFPGHGIDRVLRGISDYYSKSFSKKIYLHLIGEGPELQKLKQLTSTLSISPYVFFYGPLNGEKKDAIYQKCNCGCGPLASHRTGYKLASPLKTKEYLAYGIPFICSYDEIGPINNSDFILKIAANENAIDIKSVVEFLDALYSQYGKDIQKHIQNKAKTLMSWSSILRVIDNG